MHPVALAGTAAGRLAHHAVSGVVGALIVKGAAKHLPGAKPAVRKAVVGSVAGGIVAGRWLAAAAEEARLKVGDVLAEARTSLGEEVPPPSAVATEGPEPDHGHEH
ncbi:DUF1490 family protein [Streptomyces sp. WZ-12]|uniref:DUF1490 family protein n=1 Tax=Streptomyces sp. WZ-12 TaxID=3030210 RepID=UPI002380E326|nr:DUF1490 family protein [Streptomyces sp. WZ-12]